MLRIALPFVGIGSNLAGALTGSAVLGWRFLLTTVVRPSSIPRCGA